MNTPKPCNKCTYCTYDIMYEDEPAWCKLSEHQIKLKEYRWGDISCPSFKDWENDE